MSKIEFHPLSELFPLMTGAAFDELVADIKANGLREAIWRHDGKIVDGRNRYRACLDADVEPEFREWDRKGTLTAFVVSLNIHRRHLSEAQRAMIGAKIANIPKHVTARHPGRHDVSIDTSSPVELVTIPKAAEMMNVGRCSVNRAKRIIAEGAPEVIKAVESGEISLHAAKQIIDEPKEEQVAALEARRQGMLHESKARNNGNGQIITKTRKMTGRKAPEAVRGAIGTLVGLATGLDSFSVKDAAPTADGAMQWEKDLALVISAINRFRRQLKEEGATHV